MTRRLYVTALALAGVVWLGFLVVAANHYRPPRAPPSGPEWSYMVSPIGAVVAVRVSERAQALALSYEPATLAQIAEFDAEYSETRAGEAFAVALAGAVPLFALVALRRWWSWLRRCEP